MRCACCGRNRRGRCAVSEVLDCLLRWLANAGVFVGMVLLAILFGWLRSDPD